MTPPKKIFKVLASFQGKSTIFIPALNIQDAFDKTQEYLEYEIGAGLSHVTVLDVSPVEGESDDF